MFIVMVTEFVERFVELSWVIVSSVVKVVNLVECFVTLYSGRRVSSVFLRVVLGDNRVFVRVCVYVCLIPDSFLFRGTGSYTLSPIFYL